MNSGSMKLPALLLTMALFSGTSFAAEPAGIDGTLQAFFKTYCLRCHDGQKQEGKFRLDTLPRDFADQSNAQRWGEVMFRMNSGEMPPKDEPQPKPAELGQVAEWISTRITEGEAARMAKRGPVTHYRLSRDEYANTVYDLLGVRYDVKLPGAFNEDPRWHGFERIGSMLSLSPSHVDRYFKGAEAVLERAFPEQQPKVTKERRDANDGREKWLAEHGVSGRVRWPFWAGGRRHLMNVSRPGKYRIQIQLSGMQPPLGRTPHLSIWHQQLKRSIFDQDIIAPEDKPVILDFETDLSPGGFELVNEVAGGFNETGNHTLNVLNGGGSVFTSSRDVRYLNPTGYKLFDDNGQAMYPMLLVDWIEWEGPLTTESDLHKREGLVPQKDGDLVEAAECLRRLATRAWRRPVTDAEVSRYIKVVESELAAGEKFRSAYRAAMVGVLTSKNFYYIEEGSAAKPRNKINDWELASRLSYFLWGSMPDDELFAVAQSGKLLEPDVLRSQFARMLRDEKIQRFTEAFPQQWLQLHKVGMFPLDPKLYPDYDKWLERSMVLETTHFFGEVFSKNLSLREFLASNWTTVNPRLAMHYKLSPAQESGFQRVTLGPDDHRGGLLTQSSVLMLTSDGARHRPVHRGVWVSEAIFGRTPPPPPPNVEPLEPTPSNKPKATIRMQLEAHATHATCASCHQKIDPLGFAFDNFDAIGQWRTEERVTAGQGANPPVNASGVLPDGRTFQGAEEFKQLLAQDIDRFAEAFVEQLATFALRRVMAIDDAPQIKAIAQASKTDGYKLQTVIEHLVMSNLFQKR
jgi:mono/diheme cytochrome c family protein